MNYHRIAISLGLFFWMVTPAAAGDIQQGIHGMEWGSFISQYDELTKVHEANQTAYYTNSNMIYQSANQPVAGLCYGFYRDQLFAVFIKLRSADQFNELERRFTTKHGKPKTTDNPESSQTVHRWQDADVTIRLKMKEAPREFKLSIYYAPLALSLNQEQLENIPSDAYDNSPSKPNTTVKSAPLLD